MLKTKIFTSFDKAFASIKKFPLYKKLHKNKHFNRGFPFLLVVFGLTYIIPHFQSVRYEFRKCTTISRQELKASGLENYVIPTTLEEEYEKIKNLDVDNWENVRGPRLFE